MNYFFNRFKIAQSLEKVEKTDLNLTHDLDIPKEKVDTLDLADIDNILDQGYKVEEDMVQSIQEDLFQQYEDYLIDTEI